MSDKKSSCQNRNFRDITVCTKNAAAKTNARLSGEMMQQVLDIRMEERPASVGALASSVQGFDSVRSFISSATVFAYVDLPFAIFFFAVIGIIAFPLVAIETVKTQGCEGQMQNRWEKTVGFLEQVNIQLRYLSNSVVSWTQWIQLTTSIATMVVGVYLIIDQTISMGSLIAVSMLSSRAIGPISKVTGLLMQYYSTSRSLAALDDVMKKGTEHPEGTVFISPPKLQGEVEFKDVSFTYPEQEKSALTGVSFRINAGEKVALIGAIGSGKTTVAKLLLGLYRSEGAILLDGINILQIDPAELRRNIGSVSQDVMLFFGTLRENLLIGNPHATDAELLEASRISGVDVFAASYPKGFDMQIAERGANLSLGQRQSVAIARSMLKKSQLLLLDEPTSSVDVATEEKIRKNITAFAVNRTLLLITHRTALLDLVDRIIVLDGGRF